jgi:hypothetical protein
VLLRDPQKSLKILKCSSWILEDPKMILKRFSNEYILKILQNITSL